MQLTFVPFINELHRFNGLNIQAGCQPEPFEPSRLTCWWDCSYLGERALAPLAASFCSVSVSCGFGQIDSRRLVIDPVGGAGNHWDGHAVETFGASMSLTDQAGTDTAARRAKGVRGLLRRFRPWGKNHLILTPAGRRPRPILAADCALPAGWASVTVNRFYRD